MNTSRLTQPLLFIIGCELVGLFGAFFTSSSISTWYTHPQKPLLNPPNWIFGPVWTVLYAFMGFAAYLVWKKGTHLSSVKKALSLFIIQLVLNAAWSIIFFGWRNLHASLIEIICLWIFILLTMIAFRPLSRSAFYLLIPYLGWVSFATYLNYALWRLNMSL